MTNGQGRAWTVRHCLCVFVVLGTLIPFAPLAIAAELVSGDLTIDLVNRVFPGADRVGPASGDPPAHTVSRGDQQLGYVFSSLAVAETAGYGGKPFDILVGLDTQGLITGAFIRHHQEPILIIGVAEQSLHDFVAQYKHVDIRQPTKLGAAGSGTSAIDSISGATISSMVMNDAIIRAARLVARARGVIDTAHGGAARIDLDGFREADWPTLIASGAIGHLHLLRGDVEAALAAVGAPAVVDFDPDDTFIDLYAGLATPAAIGQNLFEPSDFTKARNALPIGGHLVVIAGWGLYSFKGTGYVKSGTFDRVQLVQGERAIVLKKEWHRGFESLVAANLPPLREIALFSIPPDAGFRAEDAWRLDLTVSRKKSDGETARAVFGLRYQLPNTLILAPKADTTALSLAAFFAADAPLWIQAWRNQPVRISILILALLALTGVLFLQDAVSRHPALHAGIRTSFLLFTLLWLGWYAGAQLSIINVLTFIHALMEDFRWEFFLLEPLIFILWSFVAVTILFWGRGVYCGWLCPFGALQELANMVARRLNVPQYSPRFSIHERLWPLKYLLFLILLALSLNTMELAVTASEVEPFKTAISLKFMRHWPFLLYVALLLCAGLFIERFFCRYLCPLGAALAIPSRLRMFEWLKRRKQCGAECGICATRCTVQSIHPNGAINPSECIYCLECQMHYYDNHLCPPLIARRKRREARAAAAAAATKQPAA